ncbi:MAG TPA: serine/threonine-protein kinase [Gemmataceae bacterium]|nr:serine/threonine-protein kinase [Gemmataceae bacterium]
MLSPTPAEERDQRLAQLLADLGEQMRQGRPPDLDAVAAQHPDLAVELRELWGAVLFAEELAHPPSGGRKPPEPTLRGLTPPAQNDAPYTSKSFGDYELLEEIGRGGMGIVYKARQRSLNRPVALKMILNGELATSEDLARFRREAQAAAHLEHPNIVPVYNAGDHEGQAYFSMRLVEGQTLAALLARGPLRPRDAARYLAAISRAVQYAHEHGILHRDLKPSNILIDANEEPHITDFGLAKRADWTSGTQAPPAALTATGAIVGTPAYMAPEQVSNRRGTPSPASDVYSLGIILYEMLTGRPPFQAPTPIDTLLLVLDQDPVPPRLFNPGVDADLEMICLKCIQKEPELRYASARALAVDLEAYLHGEPLSVRSGRLASVFNRTFRETPHAVVMENFGLLWMWHSAIVLLMCGVTTGLACSAVANPLWYLLLWGGGLIVWAFIFWQLRKRAGPVLFIERQVAHVWGSAIAATVGVFVVEYLLGLKVLSLAPMLAVIAGITFAVKASMLSGVFYFASAAEFLSAVPMALPPLYPKYGILLFGVVTAVCFFLPGLKYYRQRVRATQSEKPLAA